MLTEHKKLTAGLIPRTYLLVDLDNICGGCRNMSQSSVAHIAKNLFGGLARADVDLKGSMVSLAFGVEAVYREPAFLTAWPRSPRPRLLQGHGVDGADERILDALSNDPALRRSKTVIVASGDGIYSAAIHDLNKLGIETITACNSSSLSSKLKIACQLHIEIPEPPSIEMAWIA